ncbi:MAG: hypothetical protein KDK71_00195 [Chlamydiia bacterium]|nr:hypothetical protein [Chlamydiia bacterium]
MVFIKAKVGPPLAGDPESKFTVQYFDKQGNMTIRSGGSRSWRCNNPGNLISSGYSTSKSRRSIGTAGDKTDTYAVYPDYETGLEALIVMLKGSVYSPLTLRDAIKRYDKKNPKYIDAIVKITKLDPERTLCSLDDLEFEQFWKAIESIEKWTVGTEDFIEKWVISGVHKNRGVITEYFIQTNQGPRWVSKQEALEMAFEGRLHATLVHLKTGTYYLRPLFGSTPFECMI